METLIAAIILGLTYVGVAFTRLPGVNIDRPSAAFTGGVLMIAFGILTFDEAIDAIDFRTLGLLLGMMILISALKVVGFFNLLATRTLSLASTPKRLLILVIAATAVSSALLVNDAVVLLFTPIVIGVCRARGINPIPYLIAEAMASNIGSTATIIGNPQNMLIGTTSGISFAQFTAYLLPVAVVSAIALTLILLRVYRKTLSEAFPDGPPPEVTPPSYDRAAITRLVPILGLTTIAFFLSSAFDLEIAVIALASAGAVMLVGKAGPAAVIREVDWVLLLFFAGLFIVIGGAHSTGLLDVFINEVTFTPDASGIASISIASTILSQLVSNVPLTMLLLPIVRTIPGNVLWISLAAGSTLGGNLTIIGAVANIIVIEGAAKEGIRIGFVEFARVGSIVTVATVSLSILILAAEHWLGWLN